MKKFFEVRIDTEGQHYTSDHIIARLSETGFDGFVEEETHLLAYIMKAEGVEKGEIARQMEDEGIECVHIKLIEDKNWNEAWESEYEPVRISEDIVVRAPFHKLVAGVRHDIIIEPRMAFGTAHHETTAQMLQMIASMDLKGKSILDMGCGTAVLAILAHQMGAGTVTAIDNDEWAYRNSLDNIELNHAGSIEVKMGGAALLENLSYDIIFANINRNILLEDIPAYRSALNQGGILLMSGFYEEDLPVIRQKAGSVGLIQARTSIRNRWMAVEFNLHQLP